MRRGLQDHLKTCFGILYRYDLLLRLWFGEKSADEKWTSDIVLIIGQFTGAKPEEVDMLGYQFT